jgi:hypothetical protein
MQDFACNNFISLIQPPPCVVLRTLFLLARLSSHQLFVFENAPHKTKIIAHLMVLFFSIFLGYRMAQVQALCEQINDFFSASSPHRDVAHCLLHSSNGMLASRLLMAFLGQLVVYMDQEQQQQQQPKPRTQRHSRHHRGDRHHRQAAVSASSRCPWWPNSMHQVLRRVAPAAVAAMSDEQVSFTMSIFHGAFSAAAQALCRAIKSQQEAQALAQAQAQALAEALAQGGEEEVMAGVEEQQQQPAVGNLELALENLEQVVKWIHLFKETHGDLIEPLAAVCSADVDALRRAVSSSNTASADQRVERVMNLMMLTFSSAM